MAVLWSLLFIDPLIILSTILFASASLVVSLFDSRGRTQMKLARSWARSLLRISGSRVSVEGLERIRPDGSYVFVSNHLSYMDTPTVLSVIPVQFRFLAKQGLFQIPFLGWHLKSAGHIPVPREDPRAAVRTLAQAGEVIRSHGISLLVFPEGGRSETGELQEFKDGAAYMAIKAQVPLVPIALAGTRDLLPMHSCVFRSQQIRLKIGEPISTTGLALPARRELTQIARERIAAMLAEPPA
jgi:1-acyl-sn-glycerol-3-phosphate acyltransferase